MNCGQAQELLIDLLYEELDATHRAPVAAHVETCPTCQLRWRQVRGVAAAADRWSAPPVTRGIAERALVRLAAEQHTAWRSMMSPAAVVGRVLLGAGAALLSLLLVAGLASRERTTVGAGALAAAWTVLYAGLLIASQHPSIRGLARAALAAAGVALLLVPAMAIPAVVEACERLVQAAHGSAPMALVLMIVAAGYTAGPLVLGAVAARRESRHEWVVDGLKLSGLYALLVAPAVALQCVALPLETTALWMTGALAGAAAAGPVGLRLGGWLRHAAAK
jgi:hypothetical protein